MGRAAGFDWMENTLIPPHTRGGSNNCLSGQRRFADRRNPLRLTPAPPPRPLVTLSRLPGFTSVHPETKVSTGVLQQFVTVRATTPFPINLGDCHLGCYAERLGFARRQCCGSPLLALPRLLWALRCCSRRKPSRLRPRRPWMPRMWTSASRQVLDISMRIVCDHGHPTTTIKFPCRLDVLYGYKRRCARSLAVRYHNN